MAKVKTNKKKTEKPKVLEANTMEEAVAYVESPEFMKVIEEEMYEKDIKPEEETNETDNLLDSIKELTEIMSELRETEEEINKAAENGISDESEEILAKKLDEIGHIEEEVKKISTRPRPRVRLNNPTSKFWGGIKYT